MKLQEARKKCSELKPQFNIGKGGLTPTFIKTVDEYLKAHEVVKIKALVAANKDELSEYAETLAQQTNAEIIQKIGFTFVLFREKNE